MEFNYEGIKTEFKSRLSLLSEWRKTLYYSVYERLIDVVAYICDKIIFVAQYYFRESNWGTAQNRESLVTMGKILDYHPHRKISASGIVILSKDETFTDTYVYTGETVIIPKWTTFSDEDGNVNVFLTEEKTYYAYQFGNLDLPVKEGVPKEYFYNAKGEANETITLYSDSIENDEIEIFIVNEGGTILNEVYITGRDNNPDRLYYVRDTNTYYCEIQNSNDYQSVTIRFGDGINSRKLVANERIWVRYATTQGDQGNIQSLDVVTKINQKLYDVNNTEIELFVTNDAEISDGSDIEDKESIRQNGSYLFYAGYACNGYTPWKIVLEAHPYIHKAILWSTDDIEDDTITNLQNKVFITAISSDGSALTTAQQNEITLDYLKDKKSPTEIVSWQPLNVIYATFRCVAKVQNLSKPVIEAQINDALSTEYYILNTDFKVDIYKSNYTRIIDNLDSVIYHDTELFHMEKGFIYNTQDYIILPSLTATEQSDTTEQIYLKEDSLEIWLKETDDAPVMVAYDDSGTIVSNNNTYVDIYLGEGKRGVDSTGLANDATIYTAEVGIGGVGNQTINITGSDAQTIDELVTEMQADLTDLTVSFIDGSDYIRISVNLFGSSTITFTDTDLVFSLFGGGAVVLDPVDGFKYTLSNTDITYSTNTISFTINDIAATPPDEYDVSIIYKTKDGNGDQTNDIRLPKFNLITSTDDNFNFYNLEY